jgi:GTP-binding protein Era
LGTPNAGKSVIVNNITRSRVTAVSAKRNTTRRRVLGIATEGNAQLTLYDTPGINEIHDAKQFQRDLATEAWDSVGDADIALVVLDAAKRIGGPELFLLHKCSDVKTASPHLRWILVLNKVDLVDPKDKLLDLLYRVQTLLPFDDCFMVSGLDGDGMADLEHYIYQQAVPREWEHERDEKTDQTDVQLAGELIRETLYHRLNKEIPYTVQQENVDWLMLKNGQLRIDQRLIVRRDQHKRILVGSNGAALRAITSAAQERLQVAFRRPISLNLRVSVSVTQDFDV